MSKYNEYQVVAHAKCHLYTPEEAAAEYDAAVSTVRWTFLRMIEGNIPLKNAITTKFELEMANRFKIKDKIYWEAIRKGRRFITKLIILIKKYDVIHPIQSYSYHIDGHIIEGSYALIQKRSETEVPLVLNLFYNRPLSFQLPNLLSSIRWLNSKNDYMDTGLYNFCLFRGDDWKIKDLNEPLIRSWIHAIINEISSMVLYPNAGSHCSSCVGKDCLKDLYVR